MLCMEKIGISLLLLLTVFMLLTLVGFSQPADSSIEVNANLQSESLEVSSGIEALIIPFSSFSLNMENMETTDQPVSVKFTVTTDSTTTTYTETQEYNAETEKSITNNQLVIEAENLNSNAFPVSGESTVGTVSVEVNHPDVDTQISTKQFTISRNVDNTNCRTILQSNSDATSGSYTINPNGDPRQVYCDMTTDGGGWTRIVNWDASSDSNDIFWDNATWDSGSNTINNSDSIAYSADGYRSLLYDQEISIPNQGEIRLNLEYEGNSMEKSASFFYAADSNGDYYNLVCGDDRASYSDGYSGPINNVPYSCPNTDDRFMDFRSTYSVDAGDEIQNYRWAVLQGDNGSGDRSFLYEQTLWIR